VGLSTATERIDAFDIDDNGTIHLSTTGAFSVSGVSGGQSDVFAFRPTRLGETTTGSFATTLDVRAASFRLGAVNLDGFQIGGTSTVPTEPSGPPPTTSGYQVVVRFTDSSLTTSQRAVFQQAADRWAQIIVGDLPDVVVNGISVDDIVIDASAPTIDGRGGILGQAGPTAIRTGSNLPARGVMQFDSADLVALEASGDLLPVILHEMGHVIGIGTIWQNLNLVQTVGSEIRFTGANAVAEYNAIFGTTGNFVPVETDGGPGTAGGHWDEAVFNNELMTGFLNGGVQNPISRVTVGALRDMGYQVNLSAADPYSRSTTRKVSYYIWGDHEHEYGHDHDHSDEADHRLTRSAEPVVNVRGNSATDTSKRIYANSTNTSSFELADERELIEVAQNASEPKNFDPRGIRRPSTPVDSANTARSQSAAPVRNAAELAAVDFVLTDLNQLFDRI
jgi:hypothetical protein